jgi:SulP family sulfate permease
LYTAIVAGFLVSALGGSRVQIGGPTGAFVVIDYGIVQKYGIDDPGGGGLSHERVAELSRRTARAPQRQVVLLVTFALTVAVDLTVAIEVGMVLAAFLFMRRMAEVTHVHAVTRELQDGDDGYDSDPAGVRRRIVPAGVEVYEIDGPFFFGAAEQFRETLSSIGSRPRVLVIRMRNVPAMDSTGLHALGEIVRRSRGEGTRVILAEVHAQPMGVLGRSRLLDALGDENLAGSLDDALAAARAHLGP